MVVCDSDSTPQAWKQLLRVYAHSAAAPLVIVASRLADERLWAEALNLGAYDVLAKPFDKVELTRAVCLACAHWRENQSAGGGALYSVA